MTTENQNYLLKIKAIEQQSTQYIAEILNHFNVSYYENSKRIVGSCPIHGGDNTAGWTVYKNSDSIIWRCFTNNCHKVYGANIFGLVRGLFEGQKNKKVSFKQSERFVSDFIKVRLGDIKFDANDFEKLEFIRQNTVRHIHSLNAESYDIRKHLIIPSLYYLNRGYSAKILDKYDVGTFYHKTHRLKNRVIVPIYDEKHICTGVIGRSIFDKCNNCKLYHEGECPKNEPDKILASKWLNNYKLNKKSTLYNYYYAKPYIQDTGVAILVEGCGDVWRFEEANIHNSVGVFGVNFDINQLALLCNIGAISVIVITDNDKAGDACKEEISTKYANYFNVHSLGISTKDIGEMSVDDITKNIKPKIDSFIER